MDLLKRILFVAIFMTLMGSVLLACDAPAPVKKTEVEKPTSTVVVTPVEPFDTFVLNPDWKQLAAKGGTNEEGSFLKDSLITIPAQEVIVMSVRCRGNGKVFMEIKSTTSTEPLVKTPVVCTNDAVPSAVEYKRVTFPKDEIDEVIISVEGNVEWQAVVEVPETK